MLHAKFYFRLFRRSILETPTQYRQRVQQKQRDFSLNGMQESKNTMINNNI